MLKKIIGFFTLIGLVLCGCSGGISAPILTPTLTPTNTPAAIPTATSTPTPIPTPTPQPIELTVLHTNDTWGYSEPCG